MFRLSEWKRKGLHQLPDTTTESAAAVVVIDTRFHTIA